MAEPTKTAPKKTPAKKSAPKVVLKEHLPAAQEPAANPFAMVAQQSALADAAAAREVAQVQGRMVIAKRFPRDQMRCRDLILQECLRPELAEEGLYAYSRGGTKIGGASIRLAETMARIWGNIDSCVTELDRRRGYSIVEASAWDLESNAMDRKVFQVDHVREVGSGTKPLTSGRDIYEAVMNQAQRRKRACILALIPGDIVAAAERQCEDTVVSKANVTPETLAAMVKHFDGMGVSRRQIEARILRSLDAIHPAQFLELRRIATSIKDGMALPSQYFDPEPGASTTHQPAGSKSATLAEKLRNGNGSTAAPAAQPSSPPAQPAAEPEKPAAVPVEEPDPQGGGWPAEAATPNDGPAEPQAEDRYICRQCNTEVPLAMMSDDGLCPECENQSV